ncbi:penicillin-insensitive murein endopeptidase, partial [Candidatus Berkelbacteria bacterium]|nr:penicillin-insensitive murein endopeptidase [Candidatus Berkelbacteria bacterium]
MEPDNDGYELEPEVGDTSTNQPAPAGSDLEQSRLQRLGAAQRKLLGRPVPSIKGAGDKHSPAARGTRPPLKLRQPAISGAAGEVPKFLARQAALLAARSALIAAAPWILGGIAVLALFIGIIFPMVSLWISGEGNSGNRVQVPVQYSQDRAKVGRLAALAGDLESRMALTGDSAKELTSLLDQIQTEVSDSFTGEALSKILNQLNTTREAVKSFQEAIEQAIGSGDMEAEGNKKITPPYVRQAKKDLLAEITMLRTLIDGAGCDGLPPPNAAGLVHLPDSPPYKRYTTFGSYEIERYQWAKPKTICVLGKISGEWLQKHPDAPVEIGDMSEQDGGVPIGAKGPRHEGHTGGIHADLWIPHLEHADTYGYAFDLQMAREFAQLLKSHREVKVVIFDDYTLEKEG